MLRELLQFLQKNRAWAALLLGGTLFAYAPALRGEFLWDDAAHVSENPALRSLSGLADIWFKPGAVQQYYPLTYSVFWLEFQAWGLHPMGYHVLNLLLHLANAVLFFFILNRLKVPGAWLAALLFAWHPLHLESVAWISELKNVLATFFYLLSAGMYLRSDARSFDQAYVGSLGFFAAALLSKTVACTFPLALLVLHLWKEGRITRHMLRRLAPFFVLGVAAGLITLGMEQRYIGPGAPWALSLSDRLLIASQAIWFYLGHLLWPSPIIFICYPKWVISWASGYGGLSCLALAGAAALLYAKRRTWKGVWPGLLFFVVTVFPALGFFNVYPMLFSFVADHYLYPASIGVLALFAAGWSSLFKQMGQRSLTGAATALLCAAILVTTRVEAYKYRDPEKLWLDTLAKNPRADLAHSNLGTYYYDHRDLDRSGLHLAAAVALNPSIPRYQFNYANYLAWTGRMKQAVEHYRIAIGLEPDHPELHNNLGMALLSLGRPREAVRCFQEALNRVPSSQLFQANLQRALKASRKEAGS